MRAFVAGASGFLGSSVTQALVREGFEVRGLCHSPGGRDRVSAAGGAPVQGDITDLPAMSRAMHGCDLVVHAASAPFAEGSADPLAGMRTVRVRGGRTLIDAALENRVPRYLAISGYWVYGAQPGTFSESAPKSPRSLAEVNFKVEEQARRVNDSGRLAAVVAQPGMVYGDGSWFREMVTEIRSGRFQQIGPGENHWSLVDVSDAGRALALLGRQGGSGEDYLVVDDHPVPVRELVRTLADLLKVPAPSGMPLPRAEELLGRDLARLNANDQRASNAKLRRLGWVPRYPSYEEGVRAVIAQMKG